MPNRRTVMPTSLAALALAPIGAFEANDDCQVAGDPDCEVRPLRSKIATA